jgi:glycosidase
MHTANDTNITDRALRVFIENHDHARSVSRFGNDSTPELQALTAKLLAMMQITQGGTIYVYQGEELGLKNFPLSWGIEEYKDVATVNHYNATKARRQKEQGIEDVDMSDVMAGAQKKARDHSRTPMQVCGDMQRIHKSLGLTFLCHSGTLRGTVALALARLGCA